MKKYYSISQFNLKATEKHKISSSDNYMIILILDGSCTLKANTNTIADNCTPADMILLKPGIKAVLSLTDNNSASSGSLYSISIPKSTLTMFSTKESDLNELYNFVPQNIAVTHAGCEASSLVKNLISRIIELKSEEFTTCLDVYERGLFASFLSVYIRTCIEYDQVHISNHHKDLIIDDIFRYISQNLTGDLSLKALEEHFFVSGEHISRKFKKSTGMPLHSFITKSRIDLSCRYILQGKSILEVSQICGFGSYNHFFKVFKKQCGMTPMEYYNSHK